jgi:response regulator RpfG family c-di-GMP phosphodiesterase
VAAAYEELRRHAGTQFFPDVVEAFIALHQAGELAHPPTDATESSASPLPTGEVHERAAA